MRIESRLSTWCYPPDSIKNGQRISWIISKKMRVTDMWVTYEIRITNDQQASYSNDAKTDTLPGIIAEKCLEEYCRKMHQKPSLKDVNKKCSFWDVLKPILVEHFSIFDRPNIHQNISKCIVWNDSFHGTFLLRSGVSFRLSKVISSQEGLKSHCKSLQCTGHIWSSFYELCRQVKVFCRTLHEVSLETFEWKESGAIIFITLSSPILVTQMDWILLIGLIIWSFAFFAEIPLELSLTTKAFDGSSQWLVPVTSSVPCPKESFSAKFISSSD